MSGSYLVRAGGAFIAGEAAADIWQWLRDEPAHRRRNGLDVRPAVIEALDALRSAALEHEIEQRRTFSCSGSDIAAPSSRDDEVPPLTTSELAGRLRVGQRHARRLAAKACVEPIDRRRRPHRWRAADVPAIAALLPNGVR
jgi:hypothetical protein